MAYSAVPEVNTSDQWSASDHNTYIRDNFAYFKSLTDALSAGTKPAEGRLTLESGIPVSSTDQADKTTLYYTPYVGETIALYDGSSAWSLVTFAELSLDISGFTASKLYDIFCYSNSGAATLEGLVWTDDSTRATALTFQDGVLVKTGATTRRYLGTIYMQADQKCDDTVANRGVWNMYNRVPRNLSAINLSGNTDQTALGQSYYVIGNPYGQVVLGGIGGKCTAVAGQSYCGLYLLYDTASIGSATANAGIWSQTSIELHCAASAPKQVAAGWHYVSMGLNVQNTNGVLAEGQLWLLMEG